MTQALKCHQKYSMGEQYNYKAQIEYSISDSIPVSVSSKCPIKKIIRIAVNLLKINPFECSLLCWLLKKSQFHFQESLDKLQTMSQSLKLSMFDELLEKKVLLLLLLNGYNVKNHLLVAGAEIDIDPYIFENIPNFDQIYRNWKPQKSLKNISLAQINKIFDNWTSRKQVKKRVDYNRMVDKILYLSKTYNVGAVDDSKSVKEKKEQKIQKEVKQGRQGKKKRKKQEERSESKTYQRLSSSKYANNNKAISPLKQSVSNRVPWFQDERNSNNELNPLRRSSRMMNRSAYEIKDNEDLINPGQSLFKSYRSKHSNGGSNANNVNDVNMFNSIRNSTNAFNLNSINFNQLNNSFGPNMSNMFESNFGLKNSINQNIMGNQILPTPHLKATESFDEDNKEE